MNKLNFEENFYLKITGHTNSKKCSNITLLLNFIYILLNDCKLCNFSIKLLSGFLLIKGNINKNCNKCFDILYVLKNFLKIHSNDLNISIKFSNSFLSTKLDN